MIPDERAERLAEKLFQLGSGSQIYEEYDDEVKDEYRRMARFVLERQERLNRILQDDYTCFDAGKEGTIVIDVDELSEYLQKMFDDEREEKG